MKKVHFFLLILIGLALNTSAQQNPDEIIGRWMATGKNLEVEVFKMGREYKAKVVWFDDRDDTSSPMNVRCDRNNPNKKLQTRKVLGLEVMHGLVYNAEDEEWQDGRIYDASSGKDWNAKASLTKDGRLKVRGYWHFQFLGQNMWFKKST